MTMLAQQRPRVASTIDEKTVAEIAQRQAQLAERQRGKLPKQKRKRGLRGLVRKLVKAARKLGR